MALVVWGFKSPSEHHAPNADRTTTPRHEPRSLGSEVDGGVRLWLTVQRGLRPINVLTPLVGAMLKKLKW